MQIKNLSIVLAFLSCALTTTLATPIPNSNDAVELSNDEVLNNNSTLNINDTDVADDPEVSNVEEDLNLPALDNIEDSGDESDNETNKYEAGSTYISTGKSTDIPTEAFEDFGVGDSFLLTEELNEIPTQAPLNNGNEDSEPELGEKKDDFSTEGVDSPIVNTEEPTETPFEDFGVGDPLFFTEDLNEVPTQAPLNNGNEDSEPELGEKKDDFSTEGVDSPIINTEEPTETPFEDFGVGDPLFFTEESNEIPTQAPINNGKNEDNDNEESTIPAQDSKIINKPTEKTAEKLIEQQNETSDIEEEKNVNKNEENQKEDNKKEDSKKKDNKNEKEQAPVKTKKRVCRVKASTTPKVPIEKTEGSSASSTDTKSENNDPSTETKTENNEPKVNESEENENENEDKTTYDNEVETDAPDNSDNEEEKTNENENENENEPDQKLENAEDSDDAEASN
jgi:hypothetical protein